MVRSTLLVVLACMAPGCGGKVVVDTSEASGGVGGSSSSTASTGPGEGFTIQLVGDPVVGGACQPVVGPDPVRLSLDIEYDNSTGATPAEATITASHVIFSDGNQSLDWGFELDPKGSGVVQPGQSVQITHKKVPGSGFAQGGTGLPCNYCEGSAQLELDMTSPELGAFTREIAAAVGCLR